MTVKAKLVVVNVISVLIVFCMVTGSVGNIVLFNDGEGEQKAEDNSLLPHEDECQDEKCDLEWDSEIMRTNPRTPQGNPIKTLPSEGKGVTIEGGSNPQPLAPAPWGNWSFRDSHNVPEAESLGLNGEGVVVALVDTGIDFGVENLQGKYVVEDRKFSVTNEVLESSADLGQVNVTTDHYYIEAGTLTVWVNGTANTDFTVDLDEGVITFNTPLSAGRVVTASYTYFAPNYGWPVALDPYALAPYVQSGKVPPTGWYVNTSKNGTGPFDVDHEIKVDGRNDFSNIEQIGDDLRGDVKLPDGATTSRWEFDLSDFFATRDDEFWYFGFDTRYAAMNRSFGIAIDMDGPASGGIADPRGNYLDFEPSHPSPIEHIGYDPNSGMVASCAGEGYGGAAGLDTDSPEINLVKVWNSDGTLIKVLPTENYAVFSVAWSPDGTRLAYETKSDLVLMDTTTWTEVWRIQHSIVPGGDPPYNYQRESISFNPAGTQIAICSLQELNRICIVNVTDGSFWKPLISGDIPRSVVYSPDGTMLALGQQGGQVSIMETTGYTTTKQMNEVATNTIETVAWKPDSTMLATGQDTNGTITIWDVGPGTVDSYLVGGHTQDVTVNLIRWIPGTIYTGGVDGKVILWNDVTHASQIYSTKNSKSIFTFDVNQVTGDVFVGTEDCTIRRHNPADWNSYVPFIAHKPDTIIYVDYEREYYETTPEGDILSEADKIEDPLVYRWSEVLGDWEIPTNVTAIGGEYFYKGLSGGEFTVKGFIEFSIPRSFIGWEDSNILNGTCFITGEDLSQPQDTSPSDYNVPSPVLTVETDFDADDVVSLSAFGRIDIPKTTVDPSVPTASGRYQFGYHPSAALTKMLGPVSLVLTDSATVGKFDSVYIDMNTDYVIDSNDVMVNRENPLALYDWWNLSADAEVNETIDPDGIPDISGGMLYFIADGRTKIPFSHKMAEILEVTYGDFGPLPAMPVPENGELLAFYGDFDFDENEGVMRTHGTKMASAIAGEGLVYPSMDHGPIKGMSPNVTFLPICNAHQDEDSWEAALYFAVDGPDETPNTGDEAQIAVIGEFVSDYNSGLDARTQLVEYIANDYAEERVTFIAASGNDGSGYGTVGAPAGPSTLVVGLCLDNTFADLRTVHHYGDVSELSSRGPTASGLIKPDVVAIGVGEVNLPLGAGGEKSSAIGGKSREVWASSELACAVTAGATALAFEAYYDSEHAVDNEVVVHATMSMTRVSIAHTPIVPGTYTIFKNGFALSETTDYSIDLTTGVVTFTQNVTKGDWINASYSYTNEYPWLGTAMDLMTSSAMDLGLDPFTQGSGFVDAYNAALMARGDKGLMASASSRSFGDSFGKDFSAFANVVAPGNEEEITVEFSNLGAGAESVGYTLDYYERIAITNYTFFINLGDPVKHKADLTPYVPWNTQFVKVTAQTAYDEFQEGFGSYILSLWDWIDLVEPFDTESRLGIIDSLDEVSQILETDHGTNANALVCTLANPYTNLNGSLMVQVEPDPDASPAPILPTNRPWKMTIECYAAKDWGWGSLDKAAATIGAGNTDTVTASVDVPIDAPAGTYGATVTASYDSTAYQNHHETLNMLTDDQIENFDIAAGEILNDFSLVLYDMERDLFYNNTLDVISCDLFWNMTPLTVGVDYVYDNDTGYITFLTPLVGGPSAPELRVQWVVAKAILGIKLPHQRIDPASVDVKVIKTAYDDTVTTLVNGVDYFVNAKSGTIFLNDTLSGKMFEVFANYTYMNRTSMVPVTLNVYAADVGNFAFGDLSASEAAMNPMPSFGLRPGYGSTSNSGDRRYFYVHIPDQGLFTSPENFYLYTETIWWLNETDINVYILGEDEPGIEPNFNAPYTLDAIGGSEEERDFTFNTATHGPKEILLSPMTNKLVVVCVSAKSFNGTTGSIQKFEGSGGWISLDNQKFYTNNPVGHMTISAFTSFEMENGISASIVGPAQGDKTTEVITADNIEYDFTLEGWLSINANAEFTKVVTVESALSWDVHCIGLGGATDLDLAIFLDGHNGGNVDGEAQWMEIVTQDVCEFEAYKSNYGTGRYCYCADVDADEALKLIAPPDGDYIIKVLGYTVNPSPGEMTLEIKTILAGVEGYKMSAVDTEFGDENPSESAYLNETPIDPYDIRSFDIMWAFPEDTVDNVYGGILVLGVPEAPELIVIAVDIDFDRVAPLIEPGYTGPNTITSKNKPSISADLFDLEKGEISQDVSVYLDGNDITTQSRVSILETEKTAGAGDTGYWTGQALYIPITPLSEGGHYYEVHCKDFANNTRVRGWYFTVDSEVPNIELTYPTDMSTYSNTDTMTISGEAEPGITIDVFGVSSSRVNQRPDGKFTAAVTLSSGDNTVEIRGTDTAGNVYKLQRNIVVDMVDPEFERVVSKEGTLTNQPTTQLQGSISETGTMTVNDEPGTLNSDGTFIKHVELTEGENVFALATTDMAGNMAYDWINITLDTIEPDILIAGDPGAMPLSELFEALGLDAATAAALEELAETMEDVTGEEANIGPIIDSILEMNPDAFKDLPFETTVTKASFNVIGYTEEGTQIFVNGKPATVTGSGVRAPLDAVFRKSMKLSPGPNTIVIEARDSAGNSETVYATVVLEEETGTNYAAIGLMILLLVVGLILGLLFARIFFGGPKEEMEEEPEELAEPKEELAEGEEPDTDLEAPEEEMDEDIAEGEEPTEDGEPSEELEEPVDVSAGPETEEMEADETLEAEEAPEAGPEEMEVEEAPEDVPSDDITINEDDPRQVKLKEAYDQGKISKELFEKNLAKFK